MLLQHMRPVVPVTHCILAQVTESSRSFLAELAQEVQDAWAQAKTTARGKLEAIRKLEKETKTALEAAQQALDAARPKEITASIKKRRAMEGAVETEAADTGTAAGPLSSCP